MRIRIFALIAAFLPLLSCRADNSQDLTAMGMSAFRAGNYDLAIPYFTRAVQADTNYVGAYFFRALSYMAKKRYALSIVDLDRVVSLHTNDAKAFYFRGWCYIDEQQYSNSVADLSRSLSIKTNIDVLLLRASAYTYLTNFDRAIADYNAVLRINQSSTMAYLGRAEVENLQNSFGLAIVDCNLALLMNPNLAPAYAERGEAYRGERQLDNAIADYDRAILLAPSNPGPYLARGTAYADKGDFSNALADCTSVIVLDPNNAEAYDNRGYYDSELGNYRQAVADCKKAIALAPDEASPYNNLAWLMAVTPDPKWRDGARAVEYARRACELTQWQEPMYIDTLAAAYAETGNFKEAVKWESQVIQKMPAEHQEEAQTALRLYKKGLPYREGPK